MSHPLRSLAAIAAAALMLCIGSTPLAAQGQGKRYAVTRDKAVAVTREVLVRQGYEVVRIEVEGPSQVVYYRAGNNGKGKGKVEKMVIRREAERVVFVDTPAAILVDIDIRLRL